MTITLTDKIYELADSCFDLSGSYEQYELDDFFDQLDRLIKDHDANS